MRRGSAAVRRWKIRSLGAPWECSSAKMNDKELRCAVGVQQCDDERCHSPPAPCAVRRQLLNT